MFSRKYRLPYYIRFRDSNTIHSPSFIMKFQKNDFGYNRYGVIVGKAINKHATKRNRLRRQVRAYIEELHPTIRQGYDMIIMMKKSALNKPMSSFFEDLTMVYKKQSLL